MSPMFISTIIGLVIAMFTLGQVGPSVVQSVYSQTVETGISKEEALVHQIQQYRTLEGTYPATVAALVSKGYWRTSDNDNGFGGNYTFTVDATKGVLSISTTIADASRRSQYLGTYKHTFRPVDVGSGVITTAFVLPTTGSQGTPLPAKTIPIASTAPSASSNTYWYDTSSGTAILKVSDGSSWAPTSAGTSTISAPSSTNIVSSSAQLPATGTNGDVRYLYNAGTNSLDTYVYYSGAWVRSGRSSDILVNFGYLMSGYTNPAIATTAHTAWTTVMGGTWYWSTANASTNAAIATVSFRQSISVPSSGPISAYIRGSVDNSLESISVNGKVVQSTMAWDYSTVNTSSAFTLSPGINVIEVQVNNSGGPAGMAFEVRLVDGSLLSSISSWKYQ